jgi:hypothetical protein
MSTDLAGQDQLDDILHPNTSAKSFRITVVFEKRVHPNYDPAVALAKRNPTYKEEGTGDWVRHSAVYTPETVEDLFTLFNFVHDWEGTEILVNHKRLPYGHQLWLPLMWFYRIK